MDNWYYATAAGQRHGPLQAGDLRALALAGTIGAQTLVWREGEPAWRPLHDFAAELQLPALPPVLPAAPPAAVAAPPASGLSGCVIALLIGVAAVFVLGMVGILAAIALPAYNDYTLRAQSSAAIAQAQALQLQVVAFIEANGRCPRNEDAGFDVAAGQALAEVTFGEFEGSDLCGLEATIAAPGKAALDGKAVWLEYDPATRGWECTSEVEDKHLPVSCRG